MQRIRLHSSVTLTVCRVSPGAALTDVPTAPGAPSCLSPSVLFPGAWSPGAPPAVISANRFGPGPCSPLSSWGPSRPSPLPLKCALLTAKRSAPRSGGVIRSATTGSQDLATGEPGDLHRRHKCHLRVRWFANARWLPVHCPLIASLLFEECVCVCWGGGCAAGGRGGRHLFPPRCAYRGHHTPAFSRVSGPSPLLFLCPPPRSNKATQVRRHFRVKDGACVLQKQGPVSRKMNERILEYVS